METIYNEPCSFKSLFPFEHILHFLSWPSHLSVADQEDRDVLVYQKDSGKARWRKQWNLNQIHEAQRLLTQRTHLRCPENHWNAGIQKMDPWKEWMDSWEEKLHHLSKDHAKNIKKLLQTLSRQKPMAWWDGQCEKSVCKLIWRKSEE